MIGKPTVAMMARRQAYAALISRLANAIARDGTHAVTMLVEEMTVNAGGGEHALKNATRLAELLTWYAENTHVFEF